MMDYTSNLMKNSILVCLLNIVFITTSCASAIKMGKTWWPIIAIGGGISSTIDVGQGKHFPIDNPITDEFFDYTANEASQTSSLGSIFVGVEWPCSRWLLQAGFSFKQASPYVAASNFNQGADFQSVDQYRYHYEVLSRQLLFEGKLLYTLKQIFHPYLLLGLGTSFNKAYHYYTNVPPTLTFTRIYADKSITSFSSLFGIGIDIDIAPDMRAGLGYRFADLGQIMLGNAVIDGIKVPGTLSQAHTYTNELLAQISWLLC